jgi:hypothetical protein
MGINALINEDIHTNRLAIKFEQLQNHDERREFIQELFTEAGQGHLWIITSKFHTLIPP